MITTSLISLLGSTILGAVFRLISMKMEASRALEEAKLKALNAQATVTKEAREYENKGFQITRRFIAISSVIAIVVVPLVAPYFFALSEFPGMNPDITLCYNQFNSGFWPFTSDETLLECVSFKDNIVITTWHTELLAAIVGLYFGNKVGRGN